MHIARKEPEPQTLPVGSMNAGHRVISTHHVREWIQLKRHAQEIATCMQKRRLRFYVTQNSALVPST